MKYCFVFGAPRSGTTYLQTALSLLRATETRIGQLVPVATFHIANQAISDDVYEALAISIERNIDVYLSGEYNSRFRALEDWWDAPLQGNRLHHVLRRGARPCPDWFIYKEPFLSFAPELTLASIPDAKIIYIYRDGRDVANSLVQSYDVLTDQDLTHLQSTEVRFGRQYDERYVPWWVDRERQDKFMSSTPYVRAIWMWQYMVERCHRFFQEVKDDDQVLQVKYEDLMQQSREVANLILDHLGAKKTHAFERHLNRARTSSIGKHLRRSDDEIAAATDLAAHSLERLGYA
jgi:hypothetical protein